jgi:polyisoprenoid-binding protein YceI
MSFKFVIRLFLIILIFSFQYVQAQSYSAKTHKLTIKGTSTMHDWTSTVTNVTVQGDVEISNGMIEKINGGNVNIVTTSIKSDKKSGLMDTRTHETLKADKHPNITYSVTKVTGVPGSVGEATVTLNGNLTISGVSKPTDLILKMKVLANGDIEIKGNKKIRMSNHGIKPPSFMLGALKVGDEVSLDIYVVLHKK